jgi:hypothetical protein
MARAFISYKHKSNPDERLATYFKSYLTEKKHDVFIDKEILIGQEWPTTIEQEIKSSDFVIVLLSEQSTVSEMVIQEVRMANEFKKIILPVRVAFEDSLPYELGAYLNRIEYSCFKEDGDETKIAQLLDTAMSQNQTFPRDDSSAQDGKIVALATDGNAIKAQEMLPAPLPAFDPQWLDKLDAPGGAVRLESPFYITRQIDDQAKSEILKRGVTLRLKGSRQMGKTSLLARLRQHGRDKNHSIVYIDFARLDTQEFENLDILLQSIANLISYTLKTNNNPQSYWQSPLGPMNKLTNFLNDEVLSSLQQPLILIMDKVDLVFKFAHYRDDFFGLIRSWHDERAIDPLWDKFNIVLAYSFEAYLFIQNLNQSPFNIGTEIIATDFTRTQVEKLNQSHSMPIQTTQEMDAMIELLGGHPFLVRKALYTLVVQNLSVNELIKQATYDDGPFSDHLHAYLWRLHELNDLREAMKMAILEHKVSTDVLFHRLHASGLVVGHDRLNVQPRCGLYADYFKKHL